MTTSTLVRPLAGSVTGKRSTTRVVARDAEHHIVVARYLGQRRDLLTIIREGRYPLVDFMLLAVIGPTLVLAPLPAPIDVLLAVGLTGLAAGRYAATTGHRPPSSVRWKPANDNSVRPALPPSCFGASIVGESERG